MEFSLTDEQQLIVDTVRTFVENEFYPHEAEIDRTGVVPRDLGMEIAEKCKAIGFFAANIPEEFGGGGLSQLDFTLVEREIGRGSMALGVTTCCGLFLPAPMFKWLLTNRRSLCLLGRTSLKPTTSGKF